MTLAVFEKLEGIHSEKLKNLFNQKSGADYHA